MEEIGKEEGNIIEEEGLNQTHDHAQLEEAQVANTNSVDSVIVEMQKLIGDTGVEMSADTAAPVDPAPIVPKAAEDAEIGTDDNANSEPQGDTGGDKDGIYVYSDVHCKSEVSLKVESDKVVGDVEPDVPKAAEDAGIGSGADGGLQGDTGGDEVGVYVYSDEHCKSEVALKVESDKVVGNVESDVRGESEVAEKVGGDDVVGKVDSDVQRESEVCVENVSEENGEKGEELKDVKVSEAVELDGGAETGDPAGNGDGGSHQTAQTTMEIEKEDNVGEDGKALKDGVSCKDRPSNEVHMDAETDLVVSRVEADMCCDGEVAKDKQTDGVSSKANPSSEVQINAETDVVVSREEADMCCDGEVAKDKQTDGVSSKANPSSEVQINAETDVVVSRVEPDMCNDGEVAKEKQTDGGSSKANPSSEVHMNAETDVVGRVEPDMCNDGEVAKEKQTDGVSSKANPSSEVHMNAETDVVVSRVEPDMCNDGEVAKQKLTNGVSSKANETDSVVCKLEHGMSRDSKIAREKLVDVVSSKAKRSANEPPSSVKELKANNVRKVERGMPQDNEVSMETESDSDDDDEKRHALTGGLSSKSKFPLHHDMKEQLSKSKFHVEREVGRKSVDRERTFLLDPGVEGDESGTEEEQAEFMKEVEKVYKENYMEFKPPKFYKEELNLLKLWRAVIKLGGYEKVTSMKLWRQVGESFNPPKTCTTVSWTFRIFYEKALLEFEKHRWHGNEHALPEPPRVEIRADGQTCGSGRALRDSAARAMQGWHSQRLFGNGEEKPSSTMPKSDKQLKSSGLLKRKKLSPGDSAAQVADMKAARPRLDMTVFDIGPPADWVKINVKRFNDCFEVYALVPGLLREEVHVQSDPVGRLIISGQPMQLDNPWGVAPFKKVVSLPSRIDPHQTSAVVTLNGQLFVRVPFEQSDF